MPHRDPISVGGNSFPAHEIITRLDPFLTPERKQRIEAVVLGRTYSVIPVIEGIYDLGNIGAVQRSAEAFGFQALHVVEGNGKYKRSVRVSQGADKWLDVTTSPSVDHAVTHLRSLDYRLIATTLEHARPIAEFDFTVPTALIFGNEAEGISEELLAHVDDRCLIPMDGFVQSLNISVAAAVTLYHVREDRLRRQRVHGDLSESQKEILRAVFTLRSVKNADRILNRLS
jgi:tRNA (guanosine-2'-O-)-methyltransferase